MFDEVVRQGAFSASIADGDDVKALHNHDSNQILGRSTSGTLELEEDDQGLRVVIHPPNTTQARDLLTSIERGDIDEMSFGFEVVEEKWNRAAEGKLELRELISLRLFDVSTVVFPAYKSTSIGLRSAEDVYEKHLEDEGTREGSPDDKPADHEIAEPVEIEIEVESSLL